MKLAIVKDAGQYRATALLAGVYGSVETENKFKIAPEFGNISYLFGLMEQGEAPVEPSDIATYDVDGSMMETVKANLLHALGMRWDKMYDVGARDNSMVGSMLRTERNQVLAKTRSQIAAMGMSAWSVDFSIEAESNYPASDYEDKDTLMRSLTPVPGATAEITVARADERAIAAFPVTETTGGEVGQTSGTTNYEARWNFPGHKIAATAVGKMVVIAKNEEDAKAIARMAIAERPALLEGQVEADNTVCENPIFEFLTPTPHSVDNVRQGSAIVYRDYQSEDNQERVRPAY